MKWPRLWRWLMGITLLILLGFAVQKPLAAWMTERYWSNRAVYPLSTLERERLDDWRRADFAPSPPMFTTPFTIRCGETVGVTDAIVVENRSAAPVRNAWFYREDMPNFHDAATLVASATLGASSQTDKVLALWALFPRFYYNYYPLRYNGLLQDPSTLFAVIGSAQCSEAAPVLETLCQMVGCETRIVGLDWQNGAARIAHCAMEAKVDGRWIYMDPDGHAVYRLPDGTLAGVEDLVRDASPVRQSPHAYYNTQTLAEAFEKGKVVFHEHKRDKFYLARQETEPAHFTVFRHLMRYDLLPRERISLFPGRKGRFFSLELPAYCNGLLEWSLRPGADGGIPQGLTAENLIASAQDGALFLRPAQRGAPGNLVIPLTSPWLMVGGRVTARFDSNTPVRLYVFPFIQSGDTEPEGWQSLGPIHTSSNISLDTLLQSTPIFGYALRLEIPPSGATLRSLHVETWLQGAPKALPYLAPGENRFCLYSQDKVAPPPQADEESCTFENGFKITFVRAQAHPPATTPQETAPSLPTGAITGKP